jgi:hypothetical protein
VFLVTDSWYRPELWVWLLQWVFLVTDSW